MKAAIYARYSSEHQSEKSIDDQIRVCKKYIEQNDMTISDNHIFTDEAISGSLVGRPGLQALEQCAEGGECGVVVVDDLSRLSRSNHQMLTLVLKFDYYQVKLVSVSDGIITGDDNAKLGIHVRGLVNEMYLDDLKKKTIRGLEGQVLRGFSVGHCPYGYVTKPVGELKLDKKGQPRYEGKSIQIDTEQAEMIQRIFQSFVSGQSIQRIVIDLNQDRIPTIKNRPGGWNVSTVSQMLKNPKYAGHWEWKKQKNVRDPLTGRQRKILRPRDERLYKFREDLIIIAKDVWDKANQRWKDLEGTWPTPKKRQTEYKQKSYIHTSPTHLLSGLLKCQSCDGAIVLISGKGNGYYGCFNSKRKRCSNTLSIARAKIEKIIITELRNRVLTAQNVSYVYQKVEKVALSKLNEVPEDLKKKKSKSEKLNSEIQNYLNFVRMGNLSKAVSEALQEAEKNRDIIKDEIESMEFQTRNRFVPPPKEWISHRLERFHETLNKNTTASALALKDVVGTIRLEPVMDREKDPLYGLGSVLGTHSDPPPSAEASGICPQSKLPASDACSRQVFKPYYVAHTKVQTLALLDEDKGSNWYKWWRR